VLAEVVALESEPREIVTSTGVSYAFSRFARAEFVLYGSGARQSSTGSRVTREVSSCRSATARAARRRTGRRYLLDTVKGADLGTEGGRLVLDFNFLYNPSCANDPKWICPLAPTSNRLPVAAVAGEKTP